MKTIETINNQNAAQLLKGASVCAAGGGLAYPEQLQLLQKPVLKEALKSGIKILSPAALNRGGVYVTISEVGAADAPVMDKSLLPTALAKFEKETGTRVDGIIPGEIGQEAIVLEAAAILDLPIVDSDLAGLRAVPRLSDSALLAQKQPFLMSPLVVLNSGGQITYLEQQTNLTQDEKQVRQLVPSGEVVTIIGGSVSSEIIKKYLHFNSLSRCVALGKTLDLPKAQNQALIEVDMEIVLRHQLLPPTLTTVTNIKNTKSAGFLVKKVELETTEEQILQLEVENEYMQLETKSQSFVFPQLICVLDPNEKRGIGSGELKVDQQVMLSVGSEIPFDKVAPIKKGRGAKKSADTNN